MTKFIRSPLLRSFQAAIFLILAGGCACSDMRKPEADKKKQEQNEQVTYLSMLSESTTRTPLVVKRAVAEIKSLNDSAIKGKVTFTKVDQGVLIVADIEGLKPGEHGFHVHEFGNCGKSGESVGAHFNPTEMKHGGPDSAERHVGDLGNLVADDNGHAHYERIDQQIKLEGRHSVVGRSIIIHSDKDDFVSQPAGASGAKIACGVIQAESD